MSIEDYVGVEGTAINVESISELLGALDLLHTQCMDNLPDEPKLTKFLSKWMDELQNEFPDAEWL
jgi:hypothetical protein